MKICVSNIFKHEYCFSLEDILILCGRNGLEFLSIKHLMSISGPGEKIGGYEERSTMPSYNLLNIIIAIKSGELGLGLPYGHNEV